MRSAFIGIAAAVAVAAMIGALKWRARDHVVQAGFWFEDVSFDSAEVAADRLGGGLSAEELRQIEAVAWSELTAAYAGLRVAFAENREAPYRVRVVQHLGDRLRLPRAAAAAGESRSIVGIGGQGAVNFRLLAGNAIGYAPEGTGRAEIVAAIGRGIGRAAAHEFAHLFLGNRDIHHGRDAHSYEYWNADRAAQYWGPMRWDVAGPMLRERLGAQP